MLADFKARFILTGEHMESEQTNVMASASEVANRQENDARTEQEGITLTLSQDGVERAASAATAAGVSQVECSSQALDGGPPAQVEGAKGVSINCFSSSQISSLFLKAWELEEEKGRELCRGHE